MSVLSTNIEGHILIAEIRRPDSMNAVNFEVMKQLEILLDQLEKNEQIRTFILSGGGDEIFISGGDLKEFHGIKSADEAEQMARRMGSILKRIEKLPCWTVAAINGAAYGGGWEIMLAFDFRIASPGTTFHFTQGKFYLPPGWGGLTRLVEKVGRSTALQWLAKTAEIGTEIALDNGLIDGIAYDHDLISTARRWAESMSKNDRSYIKALKRGALRFTKARWKSIEQELKPFSQFWEHEIHQKRVAKFLERNSKQE